jgi:hypothetical protein
MFKILAAEYLDMSTVIEPTVADNENEAICLCLGMHPSLIGELAPLLSALGHKMHKRHKSAGFFWPNWDAVLFHYLSTFCLVSVSPLAPHSPQKTMYAF